MTRIRAATKADAAVMAALCGQLGYPSNVDQTASRLAALAAKSDHAVFVAEANGRVVAFMQLSIHASIESGQWAEIDGLVVDASHRGQGIGRALVAEARTWANTCGMTRVRVRTNELRADAHRFYEREGFSATKTQRVYDRPA